MTKKAITKVVKFKKGKNNMLIISERRGGESKLDHERRIEIMQAIMLAEARYKKHKKAKSGFKRIKN